MTADTIVRRARSIAAQPVAPFTGEGAYHGSTKPRSPPARAPAPPPPVDEMRPRTLERYAAEGHQAIATFGARFTDDVAACESLPVPSQAAIQADGVTFCWSPFATALREAGPLTRRVLEAMRPHLRGDKRYVYVDSKIQYFTPGDVPVDSQHWHVDGTIVARDERARRLGYGLLHDMRARLDGPAAPPRYLAYQSSEHCATRFAAAPVEITLPELIPDFDALDRLVRAVDPPTIAQPPASIVRFDGRALHRAVAASRAGWRLWVRCVETDREVTLNPAIVDCYATVYRTSTGD